MAARGRDGDRNRKLRMLAGKVHIPPSTNKTNRK